MLYLGSDHAGFYLKEHFKRVFAKRGMLFYDCGPLAYDEKDDYPDYAHRVAQFVSKKKEHRGILMCGSGQGVCMTANKTKGIRAALCWSVKSAVLSRSDDDANILCLASRLLSKKQNEMIVRSWLSAPFSNHARHKRRIKKIEK